MQLHLEYCAGFGITKADIDAAEEDQASIAYSRYVSLDRAATLTLDPLLESVHTPRTDVIITLANELSQSARNLILTRMLLINPCTTII